MRAMVRRVMLACGATPALATWDVVDTEHHPAAGGEPSRATVTLNVAVTWCAWWATDADLDAAMQAAADRFAAWLADRGVTVVMHPEEE